MKLKTFTAVLFLMTSGLSYAGLWDIWDDPLNLEPNADKIVEALEKAGYSLEKSSYNMSLMTNQFGILVQQYHSPDPNVRKEARALIHSVFPGIEIESETSNPIEVSVIFDSLNSEDSSLFVDVWFIDDTRPRTIKALEKKLTDSYDYKFEKINFKGGKLSNKDFIKEQIDNSLSKALAEIAVAIHHPPIFHGQPSGGPDISWVSYYEPYQKCVESVWENYKDFRDACVHSVLEEHVKKAKPYFQEAILNLVENNIDIPSSNYASKYYTGGKYAVVIIPKDMFENNKNMKMQFTVHETGLINKPVGEFIRSPYDISYNKMSTNVIEINHPDIREVVYAIVPLRTSSTMTSPSSINEFANNSLLYRTAQ